MSILHLSLLSASFFNLYILDFIFLPFTFNQLTTFLYPIAFIVFPLLLAIMFFSFFFFHSLKFNLSSFQLFAIPYLVMT